MVEIIFKEIFTQLGTQFRSQRLVYCGSLHGIVSKFATTLR